MSSSADYSVLATPNTFSSEDLFFASGKINGSGQNYFSSTRLLFIDSGIEYSQELAAGATPGTTVYQLKAGDAIDQITAILSGLRDVESVEIISHGRSGGLQLGSSWLNAQTLPTYTQQLKSWGQALAAGADVLLYGCNVASGETGQTFVNALAGEIGADVAASDDLTGNAALGGDWDLEVRSGAIEAAASLSSWVQEHYQGMLDLVEDTSVSLPAVAFSSVAWGDYSGDGKLDLIVTGNGSLSKLYKNNNGVLTEDTSISLPGLINSSVAWGDYSGDGKLDLIITGEDTDPQKSRPRITKFYKNNNGVLTEDTSLNLPGLGRSFVAWGDYSGDGKLDLIITGQSDTGQISKLYKNNNGVLTEDTSITLPGVIEGSVAWGDYSGDGKLDLILTGRSASGGGVTKLYKNNNGVLTEDTANTLPDVYVSSVAWGDYSGDGKLDLIITGARNGDGFAQLYKNNNGVLIEDTSVILPKIFRSSVDWGDYSGDGKLDLIMTGELLGGSRISKLYKNNNGILIEDNSIPLPGVSESSVAWGDYSGDGKLDLIITGYGTDSGRYVTKLYKNPSQAISPLVEDTSITIPAVAFSSVAWGDYSGDGKLDLIVTGNGSLSKLYKNNNGVLTEDTSISLPGLINSSVAWGDYSGDGKLDLIITGEDTDPQKSRPRITKFYKNINGVLREDTALNLPGLGRSSVAWGDYSGDGQLDLIITGESNTGQISKLYKNNNGVLTEDTSIILPGVIEGSVAWGDYNGDGKLDLILTGRSSGENGITRLYKNNNGVLTEETSFVLPDVFVSSVAWGDYSGDGKLDLILTGARNGDGFAKLYKNNNGVLSEDTSVILPKIFRSSVDWGDYSGDGKLDLIITGELLSGTYISKLYKNNNGVLSEDTSITLPGVTESSVAWGDYSGDGKLDLILTGFYGDASSRYISKLYKNQEINAYTENRAAVSIDPNATLTATVPTNFGNGSITVRLTQGGVAADRLTIVPGNGVTLDGRKVLVNGTQVGTIDTTDRGLNGILKITLLAAATPALTQTLLRSISYSNVSDNLVTGTRDISVILVDGSGTTVRSSNQTINVTGVNDAPLIANRTVLYNGTYNGTNPQTINQGLFKADTNTTQGWTAASVYSAIGGAAATINTANNFTTFRTNSAIYAGLARQDQTLDANAGFVLSFKANVINETLGGSAQKDNDGKTDRTAFSLTLITSDITKAIELGFTKTTNGIRIFAQEDGTSQTNPGVESDTSGDPTRLLFTQAESVDTTNPTNGYDLYVKGNTYTLFRDGIAILSGRLRNYSAATVPLPSNPYTTANLIAFGDNTPSAAGEFSLGEISLLNGILANQSIPRNSSTPAQSFGVFDVEGDTVTVTSNSNNAALVQTANVIFGGSGTARTIQVTPIANASGNATITLNAKDTGNASTNTTFDVTVNPPSNAAPTAIDFTNTTTVLSATASTANRTKVAEINITDDGVGTNNLSLTGADASSFELVGNILYLKAGVTLNAVTKNKYDVTVNVDDTTVGSTPDLTKAFTLNVIMPSQLLFRNSGSGEVVTWGMNNSQITAGDYFKLTDGTVVRPDATWKMISAKEDFNGDNIKDLVWFNTASTESVIWYMDQSASGLNNVIKNGTVLYLPNASTSCRPGGGWQISAVGDLMGDRLAEFLWEDRVTGQTVIWQLNITSNGRAEVNTTTSRFITMNNSTTPVATGGAASGWTIIGLGNFDGDTTTKDILWFNEKSKYSAVWNTRNGAIVNAGLLNVNGTPIMTGPWKPVSIANIDGVGNDEIVWQNDAAVAIWEIGQNFAIGGRTLLLNQPLLSGEQVQALVDLDLDGTLDLVVRRKSGEGNTVQVYYLDSNTFQLSTTKPKKFVTIQGSTTAVQVTPDWDLG